MSLANRIGFMRDGMNVRRYHQYTLIESDTVGKHSAGVALFANLIDPTARKEVLLAALFHDLGEVILGDIPAPTKRALSQSARDELDNVEVRALELHGYKTDLLTDEEVRLLKICDCLDGLAFCVEERNRGNRTLNRVAEKYRDYLAQCFNSTSPEPEWYGMARNVMTCIDNNWRIADALR